MGKYQGKTVTESRAAKQGDAGYDATKDQVVIKTEDNQSDRTVPRSDVKD